jgi:putative endopeptidase
MRSSCCCAGSCWPSRASELGQPWRLQEEAFTTERKGLKNPPEQERVVTQQIGALLYHPLSQLYVQTYFPDSTRRDISEMVGHIKDEFAARLRSNPWLDETTRSAALEKLGKMDIQVGYPKEWIDFSALDIRPDDHFGNVQRASRFAFQRDMAQVDKPVLNNRFAVATKTTPIAVNSAYNFTTNSIDITAAILQPPFYQPGADPAANYCTIGAVIGHEITHGFDSLGRQYDPQGNLRDWWTPRANAELKRRTDVLVEQYSQYEILPGLMHNGAMTVTENTADLGGITLAHAALKRYLAKNADAGCRWADRRPALFRRLDADVGLQGAFGTVAVTWCRSMCMPSHRCAPSRHCCISTPSTRPLARGRAMPCGAPPNSAW